MTKEKLEHIFALIDEGEYNPSAQEIIMLVDEIERLQQKVEILDRALRAACVPGCSHEGEGSLDNNQRDRDYMAGLKLTSGGK
jgi:hypothetical protein